MEMEYSRFHKYFTLNIAEKKMYNIIVSILNV